MTPAEFKRVRTQLALTQLELSTLLSFTTTAISRWENGVNQIPPVVAAYLTLLLRQKPTRKQKGR